MRDATRRGKQRWSHSFLSIAHKNRILALIIQQTFACHDALIAHTIGCN
jgi:hypothetical protein